MNDTQPKVNPFYSTKVTPEALNMMQAFREAYKSLADALESLSVDEKVAIGTREMSLAKTNLEQSAMWAIKAVSHYNPDNK